jgi:hypothetical protein
MAKVTETPADAALFPGSFALLQASVVELAAAPHNRLQLLFLLGCGH